MQGDGGTTAVLRDPSSIQKSLMIIVDADSRFHSHGHVMATRRGHGPGQDHPQPIALVRECRSPALAGHLRHRATEVEVDVVDAVLHAEDLRGSRYDHRIDPVK